jgi:hypothetical protein
MIIKQSSIDAVFDMERAGAEAAEFREMSAAAE